MELNQKSKIETKGLIKNKETKNRLSKKENNASKQELTSHACRGIQKESQINWIICRIYIVLHEARSFYIRRNNNKVDPKETGRIVIAHLIP